MTVENISKGREREEVVGLEHGDAVGMIPLESQIGRQW